MSTYSAITSKYQIHIPKEIRKQLMLTKPGKAKITAMEGKIIIEPVTKTSLLDLAKKLEKYTKGKDIDIDNIRDLIDYSDL
ncbi:AbrB/MazE/SpoVT family DNA-binding domain-containing protein [candidate division WWE3 bacterium]|nr:AbrB/MazE/SpoVT family DNA-binding domain-containing protein [candidate division WWE3 bacterium]